LKINVQPLISYRWIEVERKSIFHQPEDDGSIHKDIFIDAAKLI
jgi:hypothetical protein